MKLQIFNILILLISSLILNPNFALSGEYDIKTMTKEVQSALESRRDRYNILKDYKTKGIIGENNKGYVQVLKDQAGVGDVVKNENADRKIIYQTIAEQNNLQGQLSVIEEVFAQVQSDKAQLGEMIQNSDGFWVKK